MSIVDAHGRAYTPRNAQMQQKVVFYKVAATGRILVGFPENFPAPRGMEKIVCGSAKEVERYSQMMRDQEKRDAEMTDAEREVVEAPMRKYVRDELKAKLLTANNVNRQFIEFALKQLDAKEAKAKAARGERISYMHREAFEAGK